MLKESGAEFEYREYTKDPLSEQEIRDVLGLLGMEVKDVLRGRDAKKFGFSGKEDDDTLIAAMAKHPRMLQRPIGILGDKAELGRPPENLLRLLG